ncbi:MAG: hypothetical protein ACRDRK_25945 [Pseudonocardia sp.]
MPGYGRAHGYRVGNNLLFWGADEWDDVKRQDTDTGRRLDQPPHVRELFGLWEHNAAGGADWTRA